MKVERTYWTNGRRSLAEACASRSLLPSAQETVKEMKVAQATEGQPFGLHYLWHYAAVLCSRSGERRASGRTPVKHYHSPSVGEAVTMT